MFKLKGIVLENLMRSQTVRSFFNKQLPARVSLPCAFLIKELSNAYEVLSSEKQKLFEAYCDKDENGKPIFDDDNGYQFKENKEKIEGELTDLFQAECEIKEDMPVVSLELLEEKAGIILSPLEIVDLSHVIKFEEKKEK